MFINKIIIYSLQIKNIENNPKTFSYHNKNPFTLCLYAKNIHTNNDIKYGKNISEIETISEQKCGLEKEQELVVIARAIIDPFHHIQRKEEYQLNRGLLVEEIHFVDHWNKVDRHPLTYCPCFMDHDDPNVGHLVRHNLVVCC